MPARRVPVPPGGALATPVKVAQDAPDVGFVVSNAGALLDKLAHPRGGPELGAEAKDLGAAEVLAVRW